MFIPMNGNVLIKSITKQETTTQSGIILQDENDTVAKGTVAHDNSEIPMNSVVFYDINDALKVTLEGEKFHLVKNENILGYEVIN